MPRPTRSEFAANQDLEESIMRYRNVTHYTPPHRAGIPALLGVLGVLGLFAFLGILFAFSA